VLHLTVADDSKPDDSLFPPSQCERAIHEIHGRRFGRVLEASAISAKAFLAKAAPRVRIADTSLDNAQVPALLSVNK